MGQVSCEDCSVMLEIIGSVVVLKILAEQLGTG